MLAGPPGGGKPTRLTGEAIDVPGVIISRHRTSATPRSTRRGDAALMGLGQEDVVGCFVRIEEIPDTAIVGDEIGLGVPRRLFQFRSIPAVS